jgi:hypothetical protein
VYRFAVRLPPFWPDQPAIWFAQVEAQFELSASTHQQRKFNYVGSQLNQQQAAELEDIIISPPEHEPYERLKAELVRRLSTSCEHRVRQLLSHQEMVDRKPSQFLRHIKSLAPDVPDDFLRTNWASRLPPHGQASLAGQTEGSLVSISHLADKICEVTSLLTKASISPAAAENTKRLMEGVEELSRQVASLSTSQTHNHSQPRERHRSQSRGLRSTPDYPPKHHHISWYHWKFGDEARKCSPPFSRQQRDYRQQKDYHQQRDYRQQTNFR